MPRPNPLREILGERALARRVAYERERRGWSTESLAKRMAAAGCPVHQSAIWKIEHADPPRRITYDEALAFAQVFETPLDDLAVIPEAAASEEVRAIVDELGQITRGMAAYSERVLVLVDRFTVVMTDFPDADYQVDPAAIQRAVDALARARAGLPLDGDGD